MTHLDTRMRYVLLAASFTLAAGNVDSQTFGTLKEFTATPDGFSHASLLQGADGAIYGTTSNGGALGLGSVFRVTADGSSFETIYSFDGPHGAAPHAGLIEGPDALYGTTSQGGAWGHGVVFKIFADGSAFSVLHAFEGADGSSPQASLVAGADGAFYGTTFNGGAFGAGTVFKLATNGSSFALLHSFKRIDGAHPNAEVIQGADGALYGTASEGGAATTNLGTVFRLLPDGSSFLVLRNLDNASGKYPNGGLVQLPDGFLYGTASVGGLEDCGTVFKVSTDGSAFSLVHAFHWREGANPWGQLTQATDGALYGTTCCSPGSGLFRLSATGLFSIVREFDASASLPRAGVIQAADGSFYGTTVLGGAFNEGTIFSVATDGSTLSILHSFPHSDGETPTGPLVQDSDGNLYGTTTSGGSYAYGAVFRMSSDGSSYIVLHSFQGTDGGVPSGLILGPDGALYGTTYIGEPIGHGGNVFRVSMDGSEFSVLHTFTSGDAVDGLNPLAGLVVGADGALYGTAGGGLYGRGVLFRILPDGSSFSVMRSFDDEGGGATYSSLLQGLDGALYGTTFDGGTFDLGTVFRVSSDGSSLSQLHSFQASDGALPAGGLVQGPDGTLYGTTAGDWAGTNLGTVFGIYPDGSHFSTLHTFDGLTGAKPWETLAQGANGTLYGTTLEGGPSGAGTVFKISPDGSGFSTLHAFQGPDGRNPSILTLVSDGAFYGSTSIGGHYDGGVLFRLEDDEGIQFSAPVFTSRGPSSTALVTVLRATSAASEVVNYATSDGTAANGVEYVAASGQLTFTPGNKKKTFSVKVLPPETYRGDRSFVVSLSNAQGPGSRLGFQKTAVVNLTDATPVPRLQFSAPAYRGTEGAPAFQITVLRSGPTKASVTVDFMTSDGTATAPGDYEAVSGTLTFGPGITRQVFTVHVLDNPTLGPGKFLNLTLSNPEGGAVLGTRPVARLNVKDNDQAIQFSAPTYLVSGASPRAAITVRRAGGSSGTITVQYATRGGTAVPDADYRAVAGTLTFAPGMVARTIIIPILSAAPSGHTTTVPLLLSGANPPAALGSLSTATLTIQDPYESLVQFGGTELVTQVKGVKRTALVTVKRLGTLAGTVHVNYATSDSTAVSALDYLPASGQLTFGSGVASQLIKVIVLPNPAARPDPTVNVALEQVDVPLGTPAATVLKIANGRRAGQVQLGGSAFGARASAGIVTIPVLRTGGAAGPAFVEYATSDGSAQAGIDYSATTGILSFASGETTKWIFVPISHSAPGGNQFFVSLGDTDGDLGVGSVNQAPVWIVP